MNPQLKTNTIQYKLINYFIIIFSINLLQNLSVNSLRVYINANSEDFCIYKSYARGDTARIRLTPVNTVNPEKSHINFHMINLHNGDLDVKKNGIGELSVDVDIRKAADYKFCFKPIYQEDVSIDFSITSAVEDNVDLSIASQSNFLILLIFFKLFQHLQSL